MGASIDGPTPNQRMRVPAPLESQTDVAKDERYARNEERSIQSTPRGARRCNNIRSPSGVSGGETEFGTLPMGEGIDNISGVTGLVGLGKETELPPARRRPP